MRGGLEQRARGGGGVFLSRTWWKMSPSWRWVLLLHSRRVPLIKFLKSGDVGALVTCVTRPRRTSTEPPGRFGSLGPNGHWGLFTPPGAGRESPSRLRKLPAESDRLPSDAEDTCIRSKVGSGVTGALSSTPREELDSESESWSRSQSSVSPDCPVTHSHTSVQLQPATSSAGPRGCESVN